MLELLNVFTTAAPAWSTEDLIRFSGTSRSTWYFQAPVSGMRSPSPSARATYSSLAGPAKPPLPK